MRRLLAVLVLLLVIVPAASADVRLRVLPPVEGVSVGHNGITYQTDPDGYVTIPGTRRDVRPENVSITELKRGGKRYTFDRWFGASGEADMVAGMTFFQRTVFDFKNLDGETGGIDCRQQCLPSRFACLAQFELRLQLGDLRFEFLHTAFHPGQVNERDRHHDKVSDGCELQPILQRRTPLQSSGFRVPGGGKKICAGLGKRRIK